jgi:hypothetical protein
VTLLTYWGRCTACRARLRVFDHVLGNAKTRAGFISKVTQRDDEIAFEQPDGSFLCPRCDARGQIVDQKVICPVTDDAGETGHCAA